MYAQSPRQSDTPPPRVNPWVYVGITLGVLLFLAAVITLVVGFRTLKEQREEVVALHMMNLDLALENSRFTAAIRKAEPESLERFREDYRKRLLAGKPVGEPFYISNQFGNTFLRRRLYQATPTTLKRYLMLQIHMYEQIAGISMEHLAWFVPRPNPERKQVSAPTLDQQKAKRVATVIEDFYRDVSDLLVAPLAETPLAHDEARVEAQLNRIYARLTPAELKALQQESDPEADRIAYARVYVRLLREISRLPDRDAALLMRYLDVVPNDVSDI